MNQQRRSVGAAFTRNTAMDTQPETQNRDRCLYSCSTLPEGSPKCCNSAAENFGALCNGRRDCPMSRSAAEAWKQLLRQRVYVPRDAA